MHNFRKVDPQKPYATLEWGLFEQHVTIAKKNRRFLTYIPDGVRPSAAGIFILGPDGSSAEALFANSGWRELADSEPGGMVLFFLEPENGSWNTAEQYGFAEGDTAYVNAVFAKACERLHYCVHESKNYLYGVREGGCIAHMAAMAEPALYAGLVTVGAKDVSDKYCAACGKDFCRNLDGFVDPDARKGIRKGEIPLPVWIVDDPEYGRAENALTHWIRANCADNVVECAAGTEYTRTSSVQYPANQDGSAYRVYRSEWAGAARKYGAAHIVRFWEGFLSCHQRWMADPGGSLRLAQDLVRDYGMEYHFEEIGGWMREWYVYIPEGIRSEPDKKAPLVFALHGYSCTGEIYAGNSGWPQIAREHGFILVLPSAVPGPLGFGSDNMPLPSWNFLHHIPNGPNEFLFFRELLRRVSEQYPVDAARVYVTGHSQGGMMTHALALGMPEMFAAAAPCSGVIVSSLYDDFIALPELQHGVPVPVWMFAGQEEQWLIDAEPRMDNATGKTIALWHRRNRLGGNAEERFQDHWQRRQKRWHDLCYENPEPMLRYTQVEYLPHATMPEMSRRIWDEHFSLWSRTADGLEYTTHLTQ